MQVGYEWQVERASVGWILLQLEDFVLYLDDEGRLIVGEFRRVRSVVPL